MIDSRYPNIAPLSEASLFQIQPYMDHFPSPDSPAIPYTPFMNMNINTPTINSAYCSPSVFSSSFENDSSHLKNNISNNNQLLNYTIPSNVQPFSPLRINENLFLNSPTFSNPSPTTQFGFDQWDNINISSPLLNEDKILDLPKNLISKEPTPRALKAKRCPTNKCPCGGKEDCTEPGCIKSAGHFVCPVCSIEFSRKNSMRRHVLTHINLRPYECKICQKSFYRSDIYKRHLSSKKCKKNLNQMEMLNNINHSNLNSPTVEFNPFNI